ncbi:MAG: chemotaxis protein CheD [Candidatus Hodarchaeales archaeon]
MVRKQEQSEEFPHDSKSRNRYIGIGEIALGYSGDFLMISSLGSCIGLVIYPEINEISNRYAVMGHIMLPDGRGRNKDGKHTKSGKEAKYADQAIPAMIEVLESQQRINKRFVAKMAGGAKMFGQKSETFDIGKENSRVVQSLLKSMNIPLLRYYTGGETGMRVSFDVSNYKLFVTPTGGNLTIL